MRACGRVAGRKLEAVVQWRACGLGAREQHGRGGVQSTAVKRGPGRNWIAGRLKGTAGA